jgi:hypothetical protein
MSIFNVLLIFGIIGKLSSEARLFEEIMETLLKEYYKSTAVSLYKK